MLFKSRLKCLYGSLVNYVLAGSEFQSVTVLVMKLFLYVLLLTRERYKFPRLPNIFDKVGKYCKMGYQVL